MNLHFCGRPTIEAAMLPGPSAVVCMADSESQLARIRDQANVAARLNLLVNDSSQSYSIVRAPTREDAEKILEFFRANAHLPHFVAQCQVGVGRSQAVIAALLKINNSDPRPIFRHGTYNRRLYRLMLDVAGVPIDPEPLVSLAIRVKYSADRLQMFLLSMRRQRHENWEVVAVTDGPNPDAKAMVDQFSDSRIRLIETDTPRGCWGHPYRQIGLDACRGDFIGVSNDDNYYVPGYFEQMLHALDNADLAMCQLLHSNAGWAIHTPGGDLGAWIARAAVVRQVRWHGIEHSSDQDYLQSLKAIVGNRIAVVNRPLFVHN